MLQVLFLFFFVLFGSVFFSIFKYFLSKSKHLTIAVLRPKSHGGQLVA